MDGLEATFRPNTYADTLLPSDELDPGFYEDIFTASAGLQSLNEPSSLAGANLLRSFSIAGNATHMDIVQPGLPFGSDTGFTQLGFSPLTTMNPSMICPRSLEYTQAESFPHLDLYSHEPPFPFDNAISHPSITSHSATSQEDNSISTNASTAPSVGDFDDKLFANGRGQACPGDLNSVPSQIDSGQGDNLTKGSRRRTTRRPSTVHNNKEPRQVRGRKKSTATLPPQGITNVRRPRLSSEDRKRNHTMSEKVRREKTAQLNEALLKICGLAQSKDTKALKLIHIIDWLHRETAEVDAMAEALAQVGLPTETGVPPPLPALQAAGEATT